MKEKLPEFKAANRRLSNTEVFEKVAKAWGKDKETWKPKAKLLRTKQRSEEVEEEPERS